MANDLAAVIPTILKMGARTLRSNCPTVRLVDTQYSPEPGEFGSSVDVTRVRSMTAYDVVPAATSQTPSDVVTYKTPIQINQWKAQSFAFTDKEVREVLQGTFPKAIEAALISVAESVESVVQSEFKKFFQTAGTVGTVPFAAGTIADATLCDRRLNDTKTPPSMRQMVVNAAAWQNMKNVATFHKQNEFRDSQVLSTGALANVLGFGVNMSQLVTTHTAGTGSGYLVNNGSGLAVGAKTATVDTGSGTILVGDIVTFAGHTQTYVVTAALAANNFSFEPGLVATVADNAAVTVLATHTLNAAFHREAIQIATRAPMRSQIPGAQVAQIRDEETGLVLALEYHREWFRDHWAFSVLFGTATAYREMGVRLLA